jgi:hypothetical protein
MNLLATVKLFLELGVQFLKLKNKSFLYDILEKHSSRVNKLNDERAKLRAIADPDAQDKASKLMDTIIEEKEKLNLFLKENNL